MNNNNNSNNNDCSSTEALLMVSCCQALVEMLSMGTSVPSCNPCVSCLVVSDSLRPPWTIARQAPLSMGFSRQEYWSGSLFPSPGDLPNPGIYSWSSTLQADSLPSEPSGKPHVILIPTIKDSYYHYFHATG